MDAITSPNSWNSTSNRSINLIVHLLLLVISFPVASELILPEIRTRQCRFPTINPGRETALPCPLYHSGAAGIDITRA